MNTLFGLSNETTGSAERPRIIPIREQVLRTAKSLTASVQDDQVHALVQQLFFQHESSPVRHVGFVTVEASTETATLCLEIARALAEEGRYDIGLIDAHSDSVRLQSQLHILSPNQCGSHMADSATPVDGSSPELAEGCLRATDHRPGFMQAS